MLIVVSAKGLYVRLTEKNCVQVAGSDEFVFCTSRSANSFVTKHKRVICVALSLRQNYSRKCVMWCRVKSSRLFCFARVRRRGDDLATQTSAVSIIAQSDNIASAIAISVAVLYRSVPI